MWIHLASGFVSEPKGPVFILKSADGCEKGSTLHRCGITGSGL